MSGDAPSIREYLFDLGKVVEGALGSDKNKVIAYSRQLGDRLQRDGYADLARRLDQILRRSEARTVSLARATRNGSPVAAIPVDSESRLPTADLDLPEKGEVSIYLAEQVQKSVDKFVLLVRSADRLLAHGVGMSASLLLHGPPGCGKTLLARYIAAELGLPLVTARGCAHLLISGQHVEEHSPAF